MSIEGGLELQRNTFVSALLELSVMTALLHEVKEGLSQGLVGHRPGCCGIRLVLHAGMNG